MNRSVKLQVETDINAVRNAYSFLNQHESEGDFEKINLEVVLSSGLKASFEMPPTITDLLVQAMRSLAVEGELSINSTVKSLDDELDKMISPNKAAEILQVSRPTVTRYINCGHLKSEMVGTHHRVKVSDVLALRSKLKNSRKGQQQVLSDFAALNQELNKM